MEIKNAFKALGRDLKKWSEEFGLKFNDINSLPVIIIVIILFFWSIVLIFFYMVINSKEFKLNELGDATGGLLGPMTNLISGILLYYSLKNQIKFNVIEVEEKSELRLIREVDEYYECLCNIISRINEDRSFIEYYVKNLSLPSEVLNTHRSKMSFYSFLIAKNLNFEKRAEDFLFDLEVMNIVELFRSNINLIIRNKDKVSNLKRKKLFELFRSNFLELYVHYIMDTYGERSLFRSNPQDTFHIYFNNKQGQKVMIFDLIERFSEIENEIQDQIHRSDSYNIKK